LSSIFIFSMPSRAWSFDARCLDVDAGALFRMNWALAIDRIAQRVDDPAEQTLADGNIDDGTGPPRSRKMPPLRGLLLLRRVHVAKLQAWKASKISPYLLRNLKIERPNQVWAADITYLPIGRGFLYLVATQKVGGHRAQPSPASASSSQ
jgi:transposase InsO family protein